MSLVIEGFSVRIGRKEIVHGFGCAVAPGTSLALLGRNGAGKTTLVRGLAGLLPAQGRVTLEGTALDRLGAAERSRRIGYVAQGMGQLSAQLTTFDLLLLALNGNRLSWQVAPEHLERADEILVTLGLSDLAGRLPAEMSGGQRQMVALALALVRRPRLLLLDEPTSALDLANQLHLLDIVRDYTRRYGIVTLMVLHDLNLAARYADQIAMLADGRLAHAGPVADALSRERLAAIYGVDCHILPVEGGLTAIYPLASLGTGPVAPR